MPGKLLSKFVLLSLRDRLSWHVYIKIQYGCIFYPSEHNRTLCNLLMNLKALKGPYSGPRSWSQTSWPWSFQQYFSPGFLMTTLQSFAQQVPTWSNWRIPQTKKQYLRGPKHSTKIMVQNNASQFYQTTIRPNVSQSDTHAVNHLK